MLADCAKPVNVLKVVSAISFMTWNEGNYYLGYLHPNPYTSQTLWILKPFALLTFLMVLRVYGSEQLSHPAVVLAGMTVFAILSTLAKPSYVMCLIPALAILLLLERRLKDLRILVILGAGLVLPTLALIVWQYNSTYLEVQGLAAGGDAGIRFSPFRVMLQHQNVAMRHSTPYWLLPKFVLSVLFPLTVALCYFREARRDPRLRLAWLQFLVGAFFAYFISEYPRSYAGNFIWGADITLFILFVVSTLFFIEHTVAARPSTWRTLATTRCTVTCSLAFLLHLISGIGLFMHPYVS